MTFYIQLADGTFYQRSLNSTDLRTTPHRRKAAKFQSRTQAEFEIDYARTYRILTQEDNPKVVSL